MGTCVPTGLGYENRRMWRKLPLDRWMVIEHDVLGYEGGAGLPRADMCGYVGRNPSPLDVRTFLDGLDAVVVVERAVPLDLFAQARARGIRCVLLVNPEWYHPTKPYFADADLLVARTAFCARFLAEQHIDVPVVHLPCPVDLDEFPFRPREQAMRSVYSHGWGGCHHRKGWPQVRDVLERDATLLTVRTQRPLPDVPRGAVCMGAVEDASALYADFDMACQPSRFEGVGLAIIEAMACGLPVITTDADPMREYIHAAYGEHAPELLVACKPTTVDMWGPWTAWVVADSALYRALKTWRHRRIDHLSRMGRAYVERAHGDAAWAALWTAITG